MKILFPIVLVAFIATGVSACGSAPPKPVLPDGSHRVPVNRVPPVPPVPAIDGASS
jgi:hypothetical protein